MGIDPVRWGLMSTARINAAVIPGLKESEVSELVAVSSRTKARAGEYAHEWGIPHAFGSYEEMLDDPDVEAVYISLPNGPHVEWSVRALEAGKHVLCEKPLARYPADVEIAFDAAARAGRLLMEAFMWRHHPQTLRLVELVRGGAIGELRLVRATFSSPIGPEDVRFDRELAGGALMDVGCYCVSGARLLAGEPLVATAQQVLSSSGVDVRLVGALTFPGDVLAQVDCAFDLPLRQGLEAVGSDGTLRVASPWGISDPGIEYHHRHDLDRIAIDQADRYRLQSDNFSRAIRGLEQPLLGREDALGQARAIDGLYRSAERGGVPVPL